MSDVDAHFVKQRLRRLEQMVANRPQPIVELKTLGPTQRWRCILCEFTALEHDTRCKSCRKENTYIIVRVHTKEAAALDELVADRSFGDDEDADSDAVAELDESTAPRSVVASTIKFVGHKRMATYVPGLDEMLNGGTVEGQVSCITGDPGVGKSTLIMQAEVNLIKRKQHVLHCDAEEARANIMGRMMQVGGASKRDLEYLHILTAADDGAVFIEHCYAEAERLKPAMIVINSAGEYYAHDALGEPLSSSPGDPLQLKRVSEVVYSGSHRLKIPTWMFMHVTKDGDMAGPKKVLHRVDAAFALKRAEDFEDSGMVIMQTEENKNRFGNARLKAIFEWVDDKGNKELARLQFVEMVRPKGRRKA